MRSMTAFGRAAATDAASAKEITVELKSVNNRYLDWNIRMPRAYLSLEERVKAAVMQKGVARGKIDLQITVSDAKNQDGEKLLLVPDMEVAKSYVDAAEALSQALGVPNDLTASRLLSLHGVMVTPDPDEQDGDDDAVWGMIAPVLSEAVDTFVAAREREGERLRVDLCAKLSLIRSMTSQLSGMTQENITQYRTRFEERLRSILGEQGFTPDENRVITECAIYADRVAVDEELVRLASHFDALDGLFASGEAVGRRIDFMLQETNREVNTIGSKCSDAAMAHLVADIKSELEKIREQIQNIE